MRKLKPIIVFIFCFVVVASYLFASITNNDLVQNEFVISRGVNLNGWLEVENIGERKLNESVNKNTIDSLALLGFDHVRVPINEKNLFDDTLGLKTENLNVLLNRIDYCMVKGIKVIIDLHVSVVHHFAHENNALFMSDSAVNHFMNVWIALQKVFSSYPTNMLAYECLNEPAAPKDAHEKWNSLLNRWITEIRKKEKQRILFVGTNRGNQIWTLPKLKIPDDPYLILTIHYYIPTLLTHYGATWSKAKDFHGTVSYPGQLLSAEEYEKLPDSLQIRYKRGLETYNKQRIENEFARAIDFAKRKGIRLNVGEFGCRRAAPEPARIKWFSDVTSVFRKNEISYTLWGINGAGFGLRDNEGNFDLKMLSSIGIDWKNNLNR